MEHTIRSGFGIIPTISFFFVLTLTCPMATRVGITVLLCLFSLLQSALARIECDPRDPKTVPINSLDAAYTPQGVSYVGNFICGLTCNGNCDSSPAWRPEVANAFKCQCPSVGGCDANGPITALLQGETFPICTKVEEGCNCAFQTDSESTYQCYRCAMQHNNWSVYYTCCPLEPAAPTIDGEQ